MVTDIQINEKSIRTSRVLRYLGAEFKNDNFVSLPSSRQNDSDAFSTKAFACGNGSRTKN